MGPGPLSASEIADLMGSNVVAHLATLDADGNPRVTPIWLHWDGELATMTSLPNKPRVVRVCHDARAGLVVATEGTERSDGQRPTGRSESSATLC
jgi:Pyridoxamine 5'-phosphate oxidase